MKKARVALPSRERCFANHTRIPSNDEQETSAICLLWERWNTLNLTLSFPTPRTTNAQHAPNFSLAYSSPFSRETLNTNRNRFCTETFTWRLPLRLLLQTMNWNCNGTPIGANCSIEMTSAYKRASLNLQLMNIDHLWLHLLRRRNFSRVWNSRKELRELPISSSLLSFELRSFVFEIGNRNESPLETGNKNKTENMNKRSDTKW